MHLTEEDAVDSNAYAIDEDDRVSWRPEHGARQFGTVVEVVVEYVVRDADGKLHRLKGKQVTKECG